MAGYVDEQALAEVLTSGEYGKRWHWNIRHIAVWISIIRDDPTPANQNRGKRQQVEWAASAIDQLIAADLDLLRRLDAHADICQYEATLACLRHSTHIWHDALVLLSPFPQTVSVTNPKQE